MGFREDDGDDGQQHQHGKALQRQSRGARRKRKKSFEVGPSSLASIESLSVPLVQEVVLSADMSCTECQKRVADVMSRMNETESVVVNVVEKTVILSCKYPSPPTKQVPTVVYRSNPFNKIAVIKRIFRSINSLV